MASSACGADSLLAEDGLHLLSNAYGSTQTAAFDCQVLPKCEVSYTVTPVPNIPTYLHCFSTTTLLLLLLGELRGPRPRPGLFGLQALRLHGWVVYEWLHPAVSRGAGGLHTDQPLQVSSCSTEKGWDGIPSALYILPPLPNTNPLSRSLYMVGSTSPKASCSCCGRNSPRRYSSTPPTATCAAASSTQPCATRSSPRDALIQRTSRDRRPPLLI